MIYNYESVERDRVLKNQKEAQDIIRQHLGAHINPTETMARAVNRQLQPNDIILGKSYLDLYEDKMKDNNAVIETNNLIVQLPKLVAQKCTSSNDAERL